MKTAKDLSREELELIVATAQNMFWSSHDGDGKPVWHPDTEWSWERVEQIAGVMIDLGLRPAEVEDA